MTVYQTAKNYIEVLKPRESSLLTFIGICAAVIAGGGQPSFNKILLAGVTILVASAGANGLTNYLDRNFDAKMRRTKRRSLPSGRISPPERVLPLIIGLVIAGLALAWWLHPFAFAADLVGTLIAATWRKRMTCVFPQGAIAGCAPILMGWFAIRPAFSWELLLLCFLVAAWLPLHVWSIMISNRDDYLGAGLDFFPMSVEVKKSVIVLFLFSLALYVVSIVLYFVGDFGWLYLVLANLLGIMMVYASWRLVVSKASKDAWRLYKLSSFPYLGLIFLIMCLDIWLL
jgi:protoheme IX farnesyltransferase